MKILVIGSGGREHALVWRLATAPSTGELLCAPGNPGIAEHARCMPVPPDDPAALCALARAERVDLTVVGPEQPLADGIVDLFASEALPIFGPTRMAARLESSKAFAKAFMDRHGIPTAAHRTFPQSRKEEARAALSMFGGPVVVKADGLAAGKGVAVCTSREEAESALDAVLTGRAFGSAGDTVVLEEYLEGEEASVFAVSDGERFVLLAPAQDHKRALDDDRGKNTGGMGAYAPAPIIDDPMLERVGREIIAPTLRGMREEGHPFRGCLYAGLMVTPSGPKVIEFNCRFGDPETQVVLPLFDGDLALLLAQAAAGTLPGTRVASARGGSAVCVVIASGGYPDAYQNGKVIHGLDTAARIPGLTVFHAGTRRVGEDLVTAGGRVLGVTAVAGSGGLHAAVELAYAGVRAVTFDAMHYRTDIARRGLARKERRGFA